MNVRGAAALAAAISMVATSPAAAEDAHVAEIKNKVEANDGIFSFDYGSPASPALSLAGLTADKTTTSSTFKPFIISLPALFNGAAGQSAAADIAPAWLFGNPQKQTIDAYREDGWLRFMDRLHVGLAGTNGDSGGGDPKKQKPSRLALGFSTALLNSSDPLMLKALKPGAQAYEYEACLAKIPYRDQRGAAVQALAGPLLRYSNLQQSVDFDVEAGKPPKPQDLRDLQALFGPPPPAAPPEVDRRAVEALAYLRQIAKDANNEAEVAFYDQRLNALTAAPPAPTGSVPTVTADQFKDYRAKLKKLVADTQSAHDEVATAISTDLGVVEAAKGCAQHVSQIAMYRTQLNVGAGLLWKGDPGRMRDFDRSGGALWIGFRQPVSVLFGDKAGADGKGPLRYLMFGASARRAWDETLETGDETTAEFQANTWDVWTGLEHLTPRNQLAFQYGWLDANARSAANAAFSRSGTRWLISEKRQLFSDKSGVWVGLTYGEAEGNSVKLKDEKLLFSVTFGPPKAPNLFGQGSSKD